MEKDKLDSLIEEKRREVAELRGFFKNPNTLKLRLQEAEMELNNFELAASLRPSGNRIERKRLKSPQNKGKPTGAISAPWRKLLKRMYADGNPYRDDKWIIAAAKKSGIQAMPDGVMHRIYHKYLEPLKFVEYKEGEGVRVSPIAIERFGFDK